MKDKLKEIVEIAIEKGWLKDKAPKVIENQMPPGKSTRLIEIIFRKGAPSTGFGKHYSASDLLFNHEFMGALCPKPEWDTVDHIYYMEKIVQLPTDQQRIDYVHGLIKGDVK